MFSHVYDARQPVEFPKRFFRHPVYNICVCWCYVYSGEYNVCAVTLSVHPHRVVHVDFN